MPTHEFLSWVLPSGGWYFAASKNPTGKGIIHYPCNSVAQLAAKLQEIDAGGQDAYFACASYAQDSYIGSDGKKHYRTAENAQSARSFWLDIDCGADKAQKGEGYIDPKDATAALIAFCKAHKLPIPMVILSGGGLHCYWVLTDDIAKDAWLPVARKLKELTARGPVPLLADPSRTSDIASILRPVGTTNRKPERNGAKVQLARGMAAVSFDTFKEAIALAHQQDQANPQSIPPHIANRTALVTTLGSQAPDTLTLDELKEALGFLDPDVSRGEWWPILGAIADAHGEGGRDLAREWSGGNLWTAPAARFDPVKFEQDYTSALSRSGGTGPRAGIGTIIHLARKAGWVQSASAKAVEAPWLEQMNSEYAWIESEARVYRIMYRNFITTADLRTQFANKRVPVETEKGLRLVDQGTLWLKDKDRREHCRLVMRPGSRR